MKTVGGLRDLAWWAHVSGWIGVGLLPIPEAIEEMLDAIHSDAEALDGVKEVEHAREILRRGTSADEQLAQYAEVREQGCTRAEPLSNVVDWLLATTHGPYASLLNGLSAIC